MQMVKRGAFISFLFPYGATLLVIITWGEEGTLQQRWSRDLNILIPTDSDSEKPKKKKKKHCFLYRSLVLCFALISYLRCAGRFHGNHLLIRGLKQEHEMQNRSVFSSWSSQYFSPHKSHKYVSVSEASFVMSPKLGAACQLSPSVPETLEGLTDLWPACLSVHTANQLGWRTPPGGKSRKQV